MLFRRSASIVEAIHLDGTEAAFMAVRSVPQMSAEMREGEIEVFTSCGRRIARRGSWLTRDTVTRAIRLYDDGRFQALHEAVQ